LSPRHDQGRHRGHERRDCITAAITGPAVTAQPNGLWTDSPRIVLRVAFLLATLPDITLGLSVLALVGARLIVRLAGKAPGPVAGTTPLLAAAW